MTKAELLHELQPFTDDCEIRILMSQEPGRRREAHIEKAVWLWPVLDVKEDKAAHVTLVPLNWDMLTLDEETIK